MSKIFVNRIVNLNRRVKTNDVLSIGYGPFLTQTDCFLCTPKTIHHQNAFKFLEATKYKVADGDIWYYGSAKEDYLKAKREDKIVIVNPDGIEPILKFCKENKIIVRVFYLHCHESVAIKRLEKRGDEWKEIKRRLAADDKDFTKDIIKCAHHKINTSCLSPKQTAIKVGTVIELIRKS